MAVNSLDQAIILTMRKYHYTEDQKIQIYKKLESGDFSIITREDGAREFVEKYYKKLEQNRKKKLNQNQNLESKNIKGPFEDFTTLTHYFDHILNHYGISKQHQEAFHIIYTQLMKDIQDANQSEKLKDLVIEAARLYSKNHEPQSIRPFYFDTSDLTREEASQLTSIFGSIDYEKQHLIEALLTKPKYQREVFQNLIQYVYYENDFSQSLEDQIKQARGF